MNMPQYLNHYICVRCDQHWDDEWDCMCDDRCPNCDLEMTPYLSEDMYAGVIHDHRLPKQPHPRLP
jgi:hypothetical protein